MNAASVGNLLHIIPVFNTPKDPTIDRSHEIATVGKLSAQGPALFSSRKPCLGIALDLRECDVLFSISTCLKLNFTLDKCLMCEIP